MYAITTITLNPCIDKNTTITELIAEKKMRCTNPAFEPGGGGINVARVLKRFNCNAVAIFPAGGYTGKFLGQLLAKEHIPVISIETNSHTRENLTVVEEHTGKQYRFVMPGTKLSPVELEQCIIAVENSPSEYIVISGSLAAEQDSSIIATLSDKIKAQNKKLVIDTSGQSLRKAVDIGAFLIKPNLNELGALLNKDATVDNAYFLAKEIISVGKVENVVVSLGKSGAILATKDAVKQFIPPEVKSISTVGAGDSMVAGLLYKLQQHWSVSEACKFGVACGTAATLNKGTELCHPADAEQLFLQVKEIDLQ